MKQIKRDDSSTIKRLLTLKETEQSLGIGHSKIYDLLADGELKAVKVGDAIRFLPEELDRFVQSLPEWQPPLQWHRRNIEPREPQSPPEHFKLKNNA